MAIICVHLPKVTGAGDPEDRSILQQLGQSSVQSNVDEFVENVLKGIDWKLTRSVVLDGLRHAEVRHALLLYLKERNATLKVVYVDMSEREREESEKKRGISLRQLTAYNKDLTEAQIYNVIPAYADLRVPGSLPRELAVDMIINRLIARAPKTRTQRKPDLA